MKISTLIIIVGVIFTIGCTVRQQQESPRDGITVTTEQVTNSPSDSYKKVTYSRDSLPYKELGYFDNGNRMYEMYYSRIDTQRIAAFINYFRDGELASMNIIDGDRIVARYAFYPDGRIQSRHDGFRGIEEVWNQHGKLQKTIEYAGKNPKRVMQWHANGTIAEVSEWHNENREGRWFQWDSLGNQTRKERYAMGKLKK